MRLERVAIVGAGAWGTALAQAAATAGLAVTLHGRSGAAAHEINTQHTNRRYLGKQVLSERITAVAGSEGVDAGDFLILAVPAQASRAALSSLSAEVLAGKPVVLTAKGLEQGTLKRQSEILHEVAPEAVPFVLSGPSFAADVAAGRPTAVTLAGFDADDTSAIAAALAGPGFRPYASDDMVGVELAGGLKNIYALGCGAVEGAGLGPSARAAFIARAYAELTRLVSRLGGSASTLSGLSGLGDLTLTCTSSQSRNYRYGVGLGRGTDRAMLAREVGLAEGVFTTPAVKALAASLKLELPLVDAVDALLEGSVAVNEIVAGLMARPLKRED